MKKCADCEKPCSGYRCLSCREITRKQKSNYNTTELSEEDYMRFLNVSCFAKQKPKNKKEVPDGRFPFLGKVK